MSMEMQCEHMPRKARIDAPGALHHICAMALDRARLNNTDIARKLNITPSAVSRLVARGRQEPISAEIEAMLFEIGYLFNLEPTCPDRGNRAGEKKVSVVAASVNAEIPIPILSVLPAMNRDGQ